MMASGPYNAVSRSGDSPAHFTAWSKAFLGWIDPPTAAEGQTYRSVTLDPAAEQSDYYQALTPANNSLGQYFLVANRQRVGFDRGLPGEGVLITDVNRSKRTVENCVFYNTCNDDESNKLVDVEAADGNGDLDERNNSNPGDPGDPWDGTTGPFDATSDPSSDFDDGTASGVAVYSIGIDGDAAELSVSVGPKLLDQPWSAPGEGRSQFATPAVTTDLVVTGGLDDTVRAFYRSNGTQAWSFDRSGALSDSSPAVAGGTVYVGSGGGRLYALDLATGSELWNYSTDSAIVSSPAVAGETVYVGANDGEVLALDAASGSLEWSADVGAPVYSSLAVDAANGSVYATADDGRLVALRVSDGSERWSVDVGSDLGHTSPVVDGGDVYVAGDRLYRLNPDGSVQWSRQYGPASASSPRIHQGTVYVGDAAGRVHAFRTDGAPQWSYDTGAAVETTPDVAGDRLAVATDDGDLYVLNTAGDLVALAAFETPVRSSPVIVDGDVYFGTKRGTLRVLTDL
jgi:outer membrane protein assembly factor BamB